MLHRDKMPLLLLGTHTFGEGPGRRVLSVAIVNILFMFARNDAQRETRREPSARDTARTFRAGVS